MRYGVICVSDFENYLGSAKMSEWIKSGFKTIILDRDESGQIRSATDNLVCVDATFSPIYDLAIKNYLSERYLEIAVDNYIEKQKQL
jgi:hypothetical protein